MNYDEYVKAQRAGEKEYDYCTSKGKYPYLTYLDDLLSHVEVDYKTKLGLVEIPIGQIVGTCNANRSNAFARNFMPLLGKDTEFAMKWATLYDSLEEEGMRDPIVAFEFLNRFYVQEGNKRVSVSKYMGAVSVEGFVTRVVPKKTDNKEILLYYEFMSFYEKTGINYLTFSKEGNFLSLLNATCEDPEAEWTEDQKLDFKSVYVKWSKEFLARGGGKLPMTPADALLIYLNIFGYEKAKASISADFRRDIAKIWDEFLVHAAAQPIAFSLHPIEDPKKHTLSKLISSKKYAAAWVYEKPAEISAWTYGHELGREYVEDVFGNHLQTDAYFNVSAESAVSVMEEIIADGYNIIFMTSPQYIAACAKVAVEHPDVKILNCSLNMSYRHVRSYYVRTYEAKFMIGAIAGALTPNNRIGYITDYPVYGSAASINAFALGAAMVNPEAEIFLEWSTLKDHTPEDTFATHDVHLISSRDLNAPQHMSREFGLYLKGETPINYAMPVWHWGKLYEDILQSIQDGNWKDEEQAVGTQALNYWWGMSAEAVEVIYSQKLPAGTKQLLGLLEKNLRNGTFHPFSGVLEFQDGTKVDAGEQLAPEEIIRMDKLVANVHGFIPDIDDVREEYRAFIAAQGLFPQPN